MRHKSEKNNIIKDEEKGPIKLMLMKIMWMETNTNYILNIIQIYSQIEKLYNDKDKLFDMVKNNIYGPKRCLKYIINETRNPEYTRDVNECYYILLASMCLCATDEKIELSDNFDLDNNLVDIDQYLEILKKINLSLQDLNSNSIYL